MLKRWGHRLTGTAIYKLVDGVAREAGIGKRLSPHRIRHSGITAALEATGGDVRSVQKLSRHADLNTLTIYDLMTRRRAHPYNSYRLPIPMGQFGVLWD